MPTVHIHNYTCISKTENGTVKYQFYSRSHATSMTLASASFLSSSKTLHLKFSPILLW